MKDITKIKRKIRQEVQSKAMQKRINARSERIAGDLLDEVRDEVCDLMGRLEIDMLDNGSDVEEKSIDYALCQIESLMLAEVKKRLK